MPAKRDEPSAPPQAENDTQTLIEIALRAIGRLVPASRWGMSLPYGAGLLNRYVKSKRQEVSESEPLTSYFLFFYFFTFSGFLTQ